MSESVIIALLSLAGTLGGSFAGILTSGKLTGYRLSQLETKVEKLGNLMDKTYNLEMNQSITEEKLRHLEHRLENAENQTQHYS